MSTLHNPYPRSPNPSTRSYDSSSVSSVQSPNPPQGPIPGSFTSTSARLTAATASQASNSPHFVPPSFHGYPGRNYDHKQDPQRPYSHPSSHQYEQGRQQQHQPEHVHEHQLPEQRCQQQEQQQPPYHHFQPYYSTPSTVGLVMGRESHSLPPTDSATSTPAPAYIALPPLQSADGTSIPSIASRPIIHAPSSANASSVASTPPSTTSLPVGVQHVAAIAAAATVAQQHQQQQHVQKRAYRQRRKDPSCDACRERKVKCDATETTSCSECSNRQVKCQFTKETNRRMSSIKQLQDLERQLDRMRRENSGLRRLVDKGNSRDDVGAGPRAPSIVGGDHGMVGVSAGRQSAGVGSEITSQLDLDTKDFPEYNSHTTLILPDIGSNPKRRQTTNRMPGAKVLDLSRARTNLRNFAKGIWTPPALFCSEPEQNIGPALPSAPSAPDLPPRSVVEPLLRSYYTSVHTMMPMLHWPTFQREIDRIYTATDAGTNNNFAADPSFVALFFAVLAVGGLFCTCFRDASPPLSFTANDLADAARALVNPWNNSFVLDDARTMLLLAYFLNESNLKSAAWAWLGAAVRVGQELELYLDPPSTATPGAGSNGLRPLQAEMRRRVWWAIYILDRSLALELGRPASINDDDCDVALPAVVDDHFLVNDVPGGISVPPGAEPLTHSMVAVLHVVRAYTALSRVLSAPLSLPGSSIRRTSSPSSTPSPASTLAGASVLNGSMGIPMNHLATFDAHFKSCMRVFPPPCDPASAHTLSAHLLSPLVYLLHARLLLHRHNLGPGCSTEERLYAVEQCSITAMDTANLIARTNLQDLASGSGATALVTTHMFRSTLFVLLTGQVDAAMALVRGLASVDEAGRDVATPCGRFLAFFTSCLAFKRAEYGAYLARATPPGIQNSQIGGGPNSSRPPLSQLQDALTRDEELLAYVSADLQAAPESSWVWDGEVPRTTSRPRFATTGTGALSHPENRMALTEEEKQDWGGWERLESRMSSLSISGTELTPMSATSTAAPPSAVSVSNAMPPSSGSPHYSSSQQTLRPLLAMPPAPHTNMSIKGESHEKALSAGSETSSTLGGDGQSPVVPTKPRSHDRISIANII